ncbi:MAG TPA: pitrilysin family protein [Gemmatimonadaceae bacterium]|nr:pitrilysin family protein [Gemmatimonadaceae bacterium]
MTAQSSSRPTPFAPRPYHFPRFERRALANGVQLVVAPLHKLPLVTVVALVEAGAVCDAPGREGVARLTADLLLEGTLTTSGTELTERFERLGATVESTTDWDGVAVTLTALTEHLAPALTLLAEVLRTPSFPEREVERLKAERLAELLQLRAEPRGLADEMFTRVLYGADSRYARPEGGTEESVKSITRDDVRAHYDRWYRPPGLTLLIAGDLSAENATKLVRRTFEDWQGAKPAVVRTSDAPARSSRALHIVSKPDAPQSELRIGNVGLPRGHRDYYAAVVTNAVLGGLFSSRINLNLREEHGYTYGAFSAFDWRRQAGPFVISTAVQSDVTAAAASEVLKEIDRIRAAEVTADELSLATSYLDGVFPIRYETSEAIAGALATLVRYGLPEDYFDTYRERIRSVSTADVLRVSREHLHPEALQMLVVGDVSSVRAQLDAMQFGPVSVIEP